MSPSSPPGEMVAVNGVIMVMTMAVLTHRKSAILKYKDRCLPPSEEWASNVHNHLANSGKILLKIEIAMADHAALALAQTLTINAIVTMEANVHKVVNSCCLRRSLNFSFKSAHRIALGSSGS